MPSYPITLTDTAARTYYSRLRRGRPLRPGITDPTLWPSYVAHRPRLWRRRLVKERDPKTPMIVCHLAAMTIQRIARGFCLRVSVGGAATARVPGACRRAAQRSSARKAGKAEAAGAEAEAAAQSTELSLVAKFLEGKVRRHAGEELQFNDWILLRLQAWARMVPWRAYARSVLRDVVLKNAARSIQMARHMQLDRRHGVAPVKKRDGPFSSGRAAFLIQRGWRGFTNRRIFGYLREMLLFREQGDAKELLRCINPREAGLIDAATQIHVRFRLGGALFPPAIYYKVYTHAPVTDIGAFAPRDYTEHYQPPPIVVHNHATPGDQRHEMALIAMEFDGWYRRKENNGWRPVAGETLGDMDTTARTSRPIVWHHDKLVRKEAAVRKRKERKRAWLREMYSLGKKGEGGEMGGRPMSGSDDDEDDLDALLQWSEGLDYDSYQADWLGLATSSRPDWGAHGPATQTATPQQPMGAHLLTTPASLAPMPAQI